MKEQVMSKTLIGKMSNRWVEAGRGRGKKNPVPGEERKMGYCHN